MTTTTCYELQRVTFAVPECVYVRGSWRNKRAAVAEIRRLRKRHPDVAYQLVKVTTKTEIIDVDKPPVRKRTARKRPAR